MIGGLTSLGRASACSDVTGAIENWLIQEHKRQITNDLNQS